VTLAQAKPKLKAAFSTQRIKGSKVQSNKSGLCPFVTLTFVSVLFPRQMLKSRPADYSNKPIDRRGGVGVK
jgi:hypothetical protein